MGWGRLSGWTSYIRPFYDRPDILYPIVWYEVPDDALSGPETVFTTRFYDEIEHWAYEGVGTALYTMQPYFGRTPDYVPGPLIGDPNEFLSGISYKDYLAGNRPVNPCFDPDPPTMAVRLRAVSYFDLFPPRPVLSAQGGVLLGGSNTVIAPSVRTETGGVLLGGSDFAVTTPVRTDEGGVLLGGSDFPVTTPVLTERGGVLVGGSNVPLYMGCVNCAYGCYLTSTMTVSGVLAGTHPATNINGAWDLTLVSGCTWQSSPFPAYPGGPNVRWRIVIRPGGCQINLARVTGGGSPGFTLPDVPDTGCLSDTVVTAPVIVDPTWVWTAATLTYHPGY